MSARPRHHVYLKEAFLYYDRRRLYLYGGASVPLGSGESSVLACIERGESELGVLAHSLAEMEIGGDPLEIARKLVELHSSPASILEIEEARDVVEAEVIVCSFSPNRRWSGSDELVARLRRGGHSVLHLGLEAHVRGDPRENLAVETAVKDGRFRSSFQFWQWARSLIRFHARSVLVLTGTQDALLFGDLAARNPSVVCLGPDWPPRVPVQDLLGAASLLRDPLVSLQSLFFAMRLTAPKDFGRMDYNGSSELSSLALYGLRSASLVAYSLADQATELVRLGRAPESMVPLCTGRFGGDSPRSGPLAVVLDFEHVPQCLGPLYTLERSREGSALTGVVLRTRAQWFDVTRDGEKLTVALRPSSAEEPRPAAAILFPGLLRDLEPALHMMSAGIPTLSYPSAEAHPLLQHASAESTAIPRALDGWSALLHELLDPASPRRAALLAANRRALRSWSLAGRVRRLASAER